MLREGQTLPAALADRKCQDYACLIGTINEVSSADKANETKIIQEHKDLLVHLHKSHYLLLIENIGLNPAALHLVTKNILFTDGRTVQPQNRTVEHAIRKYLQDYNFITPIVDTKAEEAKKADEARKT